MSNSEVSLEELAKKAKKHPPKSIQRQQSLTRLTNGLLTVENLWFIDKDDRLDLKSHEEICQEAKQQVLLEVFQKIDNYDPEKASVKTWVKFLFKNRYKDYRLDYLGWKKIQDKKEKKIITIIQKEELLEQLINPKSKSDSLMNLINLIKQDDDQTLGKCYLTGRPDITLKAIALKRIYGFSWKEISEEYKEAEGKIYNFFQRNTKKIQRFVQKYLDI